MMREIDVVIKKLSNKQNEYKLDLDIIKKSIDLINECLILKKAFNIDELNSALSIIKKYKLENFIESKYTKDEYKKYYNKLLNQGIIGRRLVNKSLKDVNMTGKKFDDFESYKNFLSGLFDIVTYFTNINEKFVAKNTLLKDEFNLKNNILIELLDSSFSNLKKGLDITNGKIINMFNKNDRLISILSNLSNMKIDDDLNKYEKMVSEYSKLIRNNKEFDVKSLQDLNILLRDIVNNYKNEISKKNRVNNKTSEKKLIKEGTREERIANYEKEKLSNEIKDLDNTISEESKLWIDILIDQLLMSDKEMLEDFCVNYNSYLPVNSDELDVILNITLKRLKYIDADKEKIETLENIVNK